MPEVGGSAVAPFVNKTIGFSRPGSTQSRDDEGECMVLSYESARNCRLKSVVFVCWGKMVLTVLIRVK